MEAVDLGQVFKLHFLKNQGAFILCYSNENKSLSKLWAILYTSD